MWPGSRRSAARPDEECASCGARVPTEYQSERNWGYLRSRKPSRNAGWHLARRTQIDLFSHGVKRGWCAANPVALVDRPRVQAVDPDIRFLDQAELEALLSAVPDDLLGPTERVLYLTAAMTGLRQGELVALRWMDIDWTSGLVRVRRTFTRGQFGKPKTRRSSRAVPLADRVAGELHQHSVRTAYRHDQDLVFCHPQTGGPYDPSKMRIRFKAALNYAGVRDVRFHDLRHTFGTRMAAAGAPLRAIQEWMGHQNYATTEIYADYAPDPTQGAKWAAKAFEMPSTVADPTRSASPEPATGAGVGPSGRPSVLTDARAADEW